MRPPEDLAYNVTFKCVYRYLWQIGSEGDQERFADKIITSGILFSSVLTCLSYTQLQQFICIILLKHLFNLLYTLAGRFPSFPDFVHCSWHMSSLASEQSIATLKKKKMFFYHMVTPGKDENQYFLNNNKKKRVWDCFSYFSIELNVSTFKVLPPQHHGNAQLIYICFPVSLLT